MNPKEPYKEDPRANPQFGTNQTGATQAGGQPAASGGSPPDPQIVYMARPHEPIRQEITPEVQQRYQASKRKYPFLDLSEGEFVIAAIRRHPIGLFQIWFVVGIIGILLLAALVAIGTGAFKSATSNLNIPPEIVLIPLLILMSLALIFGLIETIVYNANRFFLTNESVIQHIQTSLFTKREQTVSLANVEDASYNQNGIVQTLLDYGMIRLSTQGDETTYRFYYASNPKKQIALLNDAVEAFKNGRPVRDLGGDSGP